ncbi:MAG: FkbM family methyltransferase [Tagaea sp.]|nr:FkbM family methyltransferase [Tagaea sp.]
MSEATAMQRRDFSVDFEGVPLGCARFDAVPGRPPLLLVPGAMGFIAESLPFVAELTAFFSVLTFDHSGLGASGASPNATPESLARALGPVCEREFAGAPFAIYGASLGAVVAALMARARPSRVRALIFDDPVFAPAAYPAIARYAGELADATPGGDPTAAAFAAFTGRDPDTGAADARSHDHLWAEIAVPTLILAGDAFDATAEAQARASPGLRGVEWAAGHPVWRSQSARCAARAAEFVAAAPAPPAADLVRADEYALRLSGDIVAICSRDARATSTVVLLEHETWFEDEYAFVGSLVRPGWRVVDGGGNIGVYTLALARAGADVAVYEPNPPVADRARRAIALNGLGARVRHRQVALGSTPGTARFDTAGAPENAHLGAAGALEVNVATLDDEMDAHGWPDLDFIKLDLEGGEVEALRGAKRTLARFSPLVMSEIVRIDGAPNHAPLEELAAQGYALFALVPGANALVPFDAATPDRFLAYGFAAKPDRARALAAAGRLVPALAPPERLDDPAPYLAIAAARIAAVAGDAAFARRLAAPREPLAGLYAEAIARFERARAPDRPLAARVADLLAAETAARAALDARPGLARALTYARIARAIGRRGAAADALGKILSAIYSGERLEPDEPFMPALARYEPMRATNPGDWLMAGLAEGFATMASFAAGFNVLSHEAGLWEFIEQAGCATPGIVRARLVQAMIMGILDRPRPHPALAHFGPDNLNPEIWRGL